MFYNSLETNHAYTKTWRQQSWAIENQRVRDQQSHSFPAHIEVINTLRLEKLSDYFINAGRFLLIDKESLAQF